MSSILSFVSGSPVKSTMSVQEQSYQEYMDNFVNLSKSEAMQKALAEYTNDPGTDQCFQWCVAEKGFSAERKDLFVWMAALLGDPSIKKGLYVDGILKTAARFFTAATMEEKLAMASDQIMRLVDPQELIDPEKEATPDNIRWTNNCPFILSYGEKGLLIGSKDWAKYSPELAYNIENRISLLPMARKPRRRKTAYECIRPEGKFHGRNWCCGERFISWPDGMLPFAFLDQQPTGVDWDVVVNCPYMTKGHNPDGTLIRKPGETDEDYKKRQQQDFNFKSLRKNWASLITKYNSQVYFEHRRHFGGRIFAGYWTFNYQGNDAQKACIVDWFKMPTSNEAIRTPGLQNKLKGFKAFNVEEYLRLNLANALGLDKENQEERLHQIFLLKYQYGSWIAIMNAIKNGLIDADEPAAAYATAKALHSYHLGHKIGLLCHWDATSSGAQFIAAMTLDIRAAWLANLFSLDGKEQDRENFYLWVYHEFKKFCEESGKALDPNLTYKQVKNGAIMVWFYGSDDGPKQTFGEELKPLFDQFMATMFPGLKWFHDMLIRFHRKDVDHYSWRLPDGMLCDFPLMKEVTYNVPFAGDIVQVTMEIQSPVEHTRAIAANMVQSFDAFLAREVILSANPPIGKLNWIKRNIDHCGLSTEGGNPKLMDLLALGKKFNFYSLQIVFECKDRFDLAGVPRDVMEELLSQFSPKTYSIFPIHDCFMVRPDHSNLVREQYIYNLYKFARSATFGNYVLEQILGRPVKIAEFFNNRQQFADAILESCNYAIG